MSNPLAAPRWNLYLVGIGIGLLSVVSILTMDKALGTSSSFVHLAGLAVGIMDGHDGRRARTAGEINRVRGQGEGPTVPSGARLLDEGDGACRRQRAQHLQVGRREVVHRQEQRGGLVAPGRVEHSAERLEGVHLEGCDGRTHQCGLPQGRLGQGHAAGPLVSAVEPGCDQVRSQVHVAA